MAGKLYEFFKVSDGKIIVCEVRPIPCMMHTSKGPQKTVKWMTSGHWQELKNLVHEVVSDYESQLRHLKIGQIVECNKQYLKMGATLKIGYMFTEYRKYCYYLTPCKKNNFSDEESCEQLKDKGGRYKNYTPCGHMLVISVCPTSDSEVCLSSSSVPKTVHAEHKLIHALDPNVKIPNTIPTYFSYSQE